MRRLGSKKWLLAVAIFLLIVIWLVPRVSFLFLSAFIFGHEEREFTLGGDDYIAVSTGWSHTLALRSDGSIAGFGDNRWGMADPPDSNDFVAIAAGTYYSLALRSDGSIASWGTGAHGEKYPPDGNDFIAIAAGSSHGLALKSDGSIVGWGDNRWGQANPPQGSDFIAIAAGWSHSLALRSDGSIVGWGDEVNPPDGNDFVAIAAGRSHSLALRSDGSIVGWGDEADPPDGNDFVAITAGRSHNLALRSDGSIVGWGDNQSGQARPPQGKDFIAIAAGCIHSLALKSDGSIVSWGDKLAMKQPILPGPSSREKTRKETGEGVMKVVEVNDASSLRSLGSLPKAIRLKADDQLSMDLVYIEPGSFTMGRNVGWVEKLLSLISGVGMVGHYPDDWPARRVKITKGFYIGKYKVTSTQFCHFLNTVDNPKDYIELNIFAHIEIKDGVYVPKSGCEDCGINIVNWNGAVAFCEWLSCRTGLTIRLPTEAEWEFTSRGPEGRRYPWGDGKDVLKVVEEPSNNYKKYPHPWSCAPVDEPTENVTPDGAVGMLDAYVGEWCSDYYGVRYLKDDVIDPQGPSEEDLSDKSLNPFDEKYHVYRGAAYLGGGPRHFGDPVRTFSGFRVVVELPVEKEE